MTPKQLKVIESLRTDEIRPRIDKDGLAGCRGSACPSYEEGNGWDIRCTVDGRTDTIHPTTWEDCAPFTALMAAKIAGDA